MPVIVTPEKLELFKKLAADGVSPQRMSVKLKLSVHTVRNLSHELKIPLLSNAQLRAKYGLAPRWNGKSSAGG